MLQPTLITWILIVFGAITLLPLFFVQVLMLIDPTGKKTKDNIIGKGEEWRDKTHFKSSLGMAWADWLLFFPILILGIIGMLTGNIWGYVLFAVSGAMSVYINIILWFQEKEYVYSSRGPLRYLHIIGEILFTGE